MRAKEKSQILPIIAVMTVLLLAVILIGCRSESRKRLRPPAKKEINISGYWVISFSPKLPDVELASSLPVTIKQQEKKINLEVVGYPGKTSNGTINGKNVSIELFGATLRGSATNATMSGTYASEDGSRPWQGKKQPRPSFHPDTKLVGTWMVSQVTEYQDGAPLSEIDAYAGSSLVLNSDGSFATAIYDQEPSDAISEGTWQAGGGFLVLTRSNKEVMFGLPMQYTISENELTLVSPNLLVKFNR